ncbi:hypothetical protein SDC9_133778 [bioreactor metagenome]|uniref:Nudix hydrolase domain-containing protein n=1 Tax=bioreactor metagenome TaxID=1076179 RepID=A0A645DBW9_9ZZZZ|nr:NUDIX domain-containing protein [Oscillospiraceae bacterium]
MSIRNSAKAIIINEGKILLNKCFDERNGNYFTLPGGGQKVYESLCEAIIRECLEETGYSVFPDKYAALYEEICDNEAFRKNDPDYAHKIYHIFICRLQNEHRVQPTEIDSTQIKSEWIEIGQLENACLLPKAVGDNILNIINNDAPLYLGSDHIPYNHG